MNDPSIQGYEEHERTAMVLRSVAPQIGEEAAWFTYSCTQIPDTEYESFSSEKEKVPSPDGSPFFKSPVYVPV